MTRVKEKKRETVFYGYYDIFSYNYVIIVDTVPNVNTTSTNKTLIHLYFIASNAIPNGS